MPPQTVEQPQDGVQKIGAAFFTAELAFGSGTGPQWSAGGRAALGCLPPQLAAQFTLAEQAVLAIVTVETTNLGDCRLANEHIAAIAGVSKSTVRATLRRA